MKRININWREQRKALTAKGIDTEKKFASLWQAASYISEKVGCKHDTAKKEIRRAIKKGCQRYGMIWYWNNNGK